MSIHEFIISIYLIIEELYLLIVKKPLRTRGFPPALSDIEIITMQIVGEFLSLDSDKNIWIYFKHNWLEWFPKLGSYPNFCKHCSNLWNINQQITSKLSSRFGSDNIHFIDGFPIPVCRYARAKKHKNFKASAGFSYRFHIQKVRAKDLWHLTHRIIRKILSHTISVILNTRLGNPPLQLESLIQS